MPPKKPSGIKPPSAGGAGDAAWGKATPIPKDISAGGLDPKLDLPPDASGNYSKVVELAEKKKWEDVQNIIDMRGANLNLQALPILPSSSTAPKYMYHSL